MAKVEYPLDDTGSAATNRTVTELHTITYNADADYHFVIPDYAPFYTTGFQVLDRVGSTRVPLTEGVDFHFGLQYSTATVATGKPVYGALVFPKVSKDMLIEIQPYQTVGGPYVLDEQATAALIAGIVYNPQSLTWEQIQDKPEIFPPVRHPWAFNDMVGQSEVVESLINIANTIAAKAAAGGDHPFIKGNPHDTSKYDMDLGNVPNYGMADLRMMLSGTDNQSFVSPALVYAMLGELGLLVRSEVITAMEEHIASRDNPHYTDAAGVGLGLVANLAVTTDQDIARNLDVDKYVTLRHLRMWMTLFGGSNNLVTKEPIKQGALLSTYCNVHYDRMGVYADGKGGTYDQVHTVKDTTCGYATTIPIAHPPKGEVMSSYCSGPHLMNLVATGTGTLTSTLAEPNSSKCVGVEHPPKDTVIGSICEGKTLVRTVADGVGGTTIQRVENSSQCAANIHPPKGTLITIFCSGFNQMGRYADGDGGYYEAIEERNSKDCGYQPPVIPPEQTHPPAGTVIGTRCDKTTLYYIYANGNGGQYETIKENNSLQCGYVPPTPGPSPTPGPAPTPPPERIGQIVFDTTIRNIWIGDTEVQTTTLQNWTPGKSYTIEIWNTSVAWGLPYDRMLDTFRVSCDSTGRGQYRRTIEEKGAVPLGRYNSWMQEKSSGVSSNTIERIFKGNR